MTERAAYCRNKLQYETVPWDLNECLKNKENIVVIDTRSPETFELEHLPGAINIPHQTIN